MVNNNTELVGKLTDVVPEVDLHGIFKEHLGFGYRACGKLLDHLNINSPIYGINFLLVIRTKFVSIKAD